MTDRSVYKQRVFGQGSVKQQMGLSRISVESFYPQAAAVNMIQKQAQALFPCYILPSLMLS